jgi:putative glutamine amidotransferase
MKPVIAIPEMGGGFFRRYMKSKYAESLVRAGAEVCWINITDPDQAAADALNCDGLLLPGGADVEPSLYGRERSKDCGKSNPQRDVAELKILEAFLPTNKPILCICRGIQILNVFFGGTLHQDISRMQTVNHNRFLSRKKGNHEVMVKTHTKLGKIFGQIMVKVNSMHHQAIDQLGPGLTPSSVSPDGFIESVEVFLHPFCIGVQWHPEHLAGNDPIQQKLFDTFVDTCRKI